MKIKLLLVCAIVLTIFSVGAQTKSTLSVNIGISKPLGEYAKKSSDSDNSGSIKDGNVFDIYYNYRPRKTFGLGLMFKNGRNPLDDDAIADKFYNAYPGATVVINSDDFKFGTLLGGVTANFPLAENFSVDTRALAGFASCTSPQFTSTLSGNGSSGYFKQGESKATAFAFLIGAGLKLNVSHRIAILVNADYFSTKPNFTGIKRSDSIGTNYPDESNNQEIGMVNLSAGIGFMF